MIHPQQRTHQLANVTWDSMRTHYVSPSPRNYDLWFTHCGGDNPALSRRIDAILQAGSLIGPRGLDELYGEFLAMPVDVAAVKDASLDLKKVAGEICERVTTDRAKLGGFADTLSGATNDLSQAKSPEDMVRAARAVSGAAQEVSRQLQDLESLFAVSLAGINDLCGKLSKADKDATCDPLTGLANRRLYDSSLLRLTAAAADDKTELALLMLDIDNFKRFNDSFGHAMGDNLLRLFGRLLTDQTRGRDTVARVGGDGFAVIMPGAGLAGAMETAETIRQVLERRAILNRITGQNFGFATCSIGVAVYRNGEASGEMVERAEAALYQSKSAGRNNVRAEAM